jgi:Trk-type K+ transport system membrane component
MYLLQFFVLSNLLLFIIFNAVCLTNDTFADAYGPDAHTSFMGMFQNINMRHSGFAVFNFRDFPQSMLLVYAVAMFLSPVPYIGVLHASGE